MIKKHPAQIVSDIQTVKDQTVKDQTVKDQTEHILANYLENYADYGMDDIANDMICLIANLEVIRCKIEYSDVREESDVNLYF